MESRRIAICLLVLRLTIFLVMLIWTIDKFVRPEHAGSAYEHFYCLPGFGATIVYAIGVAELLLLLGFVIGEALSNRLGSVCFSHASVPQFRWLLSFS